MKPIEDSRVVKKDNNFVADCTNCNSTLSFSTKASALRMLERGSCRNCKRDYRSVKDSELSIYKNLDGKWCSICSGCGIEQSYTRKDHAKQSSKADWQCKSCVAKAKGFSNNLPVGNENRLFNRFKKAANSRGIDWNLSVETMFSCYTGKCALTGWDLYVDYSNCNASLDRIDNKKGYVEGNVQWVHGMVNMCKNKYDQELFINMCKCISENACKTS